VRAAGDLTDICRTRALRLLSWVGFKCFKMDRAQSMKAYRGRSGPGSVVGIATAYGLDGPGIESRLVFPLLDLRIVAT
jgi:hypothetical protein